MLDASGVASTTDVVLGAAFTGLGGAVILVYRNTITRITKLERQNAAYLSLLTRIAIKVGVDERVIDDIQKAIRSGS